MATYTLSQFVWTSHLRHLSLPLLFFLFIHTAVTGPLCPVTTIIWQQSSKVHLITERPLFLSSAVMRLLATILFLLLLRSAEPRRGPRSGATESGAGGRARGRGRAGVMRRQTQECKEYIEAGEKYLDCQDKQLTTVMQDWPKDIHHLLLARNKIQVQTIYICKEGRHRPPATVIRQLKHNEQVLRMSGTVLCIGCINILQASPSGLLLWP